MNIEAQKSQLEINVKIREQENRSEAMKLLMARMAIECSNDVEPGKLQIIETYPNSTCPLAVFRNEVGNIQCGPVDPLVISFYEYAPSQVEEQERRDKNLGLRAGLELKGPLALVDEVHDVEREISMDQLISIHTLIGNNSTWWPITDYTDAEVVEIFAPLMLHVVFLNQMPVGIGHLDFSDLLKKKAAKIVFFGIDPAVQGRGLGREVLHELINKAIDCGAKTICLDTVAHRDIRTFSGAHDPLNQVRQGSAHDIYVKSGFKMISVKLIEPANKAQLNEEGIVINQLNGPSDYMVHDLTPLRKLMYAKFGVLSLRQGEGCMCAP